MFDVLIKFDENKIEIPNDNTEIHYDNLFIQIEHKTFNLSEIIELLRETTTI